MTHMALWVQEFRDSIAAMSPGPHVPLTGQALVEELKRRLARATERMQLFPHNTFWSERVAMLERGILEEQELLEDAVIIYKLIRLPGRRVFYMGEEIIDQLTQPHKQRTTGWHAAKSLKMKRLMTRKSVVR